MIEGAIGLGMLAFTLGTTIAQIISGHKTQDEQTKTAKKGGFEDASIKEINMWMRRPSVLSGR